MPVVLSINHRDILIDSMSDAAKVMGILEKALACHEELYHGKISMDGPLLLRMATVPAGTRYVDSKGEEIGSQPPPFPGKRKAPARLAGPTVPSLIDSRHGH